MVAGMTAFKQNNVVGSGTQDEPINLDSESDDEVIFLSTTKGPTAAPKDASPQDPIAILPVPDNAFSNLAAAQEALLLKRKNAVPSAAFSMDRQSRTEVESRAADVRGLRGSSSGDETKAASTTTKRHLDMIDLHDDDDDDDELSCGSGNFYKQSERSTFGPQLSTGTSSETAIMVTSEDEGSVDSSDGTSAYPKSLSTAVSLREEEELQKKEEKEREMLRMQLSENRSESSIKSRGKELRQRLRNDGNVDLQSSTESQEDGSEMRSTNSFLGKRNPIEINVSSHRHTARRELPSLPVAPRIGRSARALKDSRKHASNSYLTKHLPQSRGTVFEKKSAALDRRLEVTESLNAVETPSWGFKNANLDRQTSEPELSSFPDSSRVGKRLHSDLRKEPQRSQATGEENDDTTQRYPGTTLNKCSESTEKLDVVKTPELEPLNLHRQPALPEMSDKPVAGKVGTETQTLTFYRPAAILPLANESKETYTTGPEDDGITLKQGLESSKNLDVVAAPEIATCKANPDWRTTASELSSHRLRVLKASKQASNSPLTKISHLLQATSTEDDDATLGNRSESVVGVGAVDTPGTRCGTSNVNEQASGSESPIKPVSPIAGKRPRVLKASKRASTSQLPNEWQQSQASGQETNGATLGHYLVSTKGLDIVGTPEMGSGSSNLNEQVAGSELPIKPGGPIAGKRPRVLKASKRASTSQLPSEWQQSQPSVHETKGAILEKCLASTKDHDAVETPGLESGSSNLHPQAAGLAWSSKPVGPINGERMRILKSAKRASNSYLANASPQFALEGKETTLSSASTTGKRIRALKARKQASTSDCNGTLNSTIENALGSPSSFSYITNEARHRTPRSPIRTVSKEQKTIGETVVREGACVDSLAPSSLGRSNVGERYTGNIFQDESSATHLDNAAHLLRSRHADREEDNDLPDWISPIEHLSKRYCDKRTGLPVWEFTVHAGDDSILYDFKAFAAKSSIHGAGLGAFLEFQGARRLRKSSYEVQQRLSEKLLPFAPRTMSPLQAISEHGSVTTVLLKGENLHGNRNRLYWPRENLKRLSAVFSTQQVNGSEVVQKRRETVNICCEHLNSINSIPEYEALSVHGSNSLQPIGHFGIHIESDYARDPTIGRFVLPENCIDLGRYGPFRPEDRKIYDLFELKLFVFSQVPGEWVFELREENPDLPRQALDITCDLTGEPHDLASSNIPKYVNEIGPMDKTRQNVFTSDSGSKVIRYFYFSQTRLKRGRPTELLTNYKGGYESVRERKGYGFRNISEGLESDQVLSMRLQRNFEDRQDVENLVDGVETVQKLWCIVQFLYQNIWLPLLGRIERAEELSCNQCIAVRRLSWFVELFRKKLKHECGTVEAGNGLFLFYEYNISTALTHMDEFMNCALFDTFNTLIENNRHLRSSMETELMEEVCFELRQKLVLVMNESIYCPFAMRLINLLCQEVAWIWLFRDLTCPQSEARAKRTLLERLYEVADIAKRDLLECIRCRKVKELLFTSGLKEPSVLVGDTRDIRTSFRISDSFYLENSVTPKGVKAAFVERLQYEDSLMLAGLAPHSSSQANAICNDVAMVKFSNFQSFPELSSIGAVPVATSRIARGDMVLATDWYMNWQVIWIIDLFAHYYTSDTDYSLEELCIRLGSDIALAEFTRQRGVRWDEGNEWKKHVKKLSAKKPTDTTSKLPNQNPGLPKAKPRRPPLCIYEGKPLTTFPGEGDRWPEGWTQKTFQRGSGASKGSTDDYWFPPSGTPKLRSKPDILRYLKQNSRHLI